MKSDHCEKVSKNLLTQPSTSLKWSSKPNVRGKYHKIEPVKDTHSFPKPHCKLDWKTPVRSFGRETVVHVHCEVEVSPKLATQAEIIISHSVDTRKFSAPPFLVLSPRQQHDQPYAGHPVLCLQEGEKLSS